MISETEPIMISLKAIVPGAIIIFTGGLITGLWIAHSAWKKQLEKTFG